MVRAILIEISTSAPYRPGHRLLSDVTPEPQVNRPPPPPPPLYGSWPLSLLVPVWQQAPPSLATHSQSCTFHPSLVHFTPVLYISPHAQLEGGTNWVPCRRGPIPSLCLGEGARRGQVKGGGGWRWFAYMVQVWCHHPDQSPEGIIAQYGGTGSWDLWCIYWNI